MSAVVAPNQFAWLINTMMVVSIAAFAASAFWALKLRKEARISDFAAKRAARRGHVILGAWVLLPAIWFFVEFQWLHPNMIDSFELGRVKHAQELARNIWIAFVIVLAAIIGVKWPPGH